VYAKKDNEPVGVINGDLLDFRDFCWCAI